MLVLTVDKSKLLCYSSYWECECHEKTPTILRHNLWGISFPLHSKGKKLFAVFHMCMLLITQYTCTSFFCFCVYICHDSSVECARNCAVIKL